MEKRPGKKRRWSEEDLRDAVTEATSVYGVFRHMGLKVGGGQHMLIKQLIRSLGLDPSHFKGQAWNKGMKFADRELIPLDDILVPRSTYSDNRQLKRRLIEAGLLDERCAICDLLPEWQGARLVLRLDHINGIRNDHRLQNLRLLCPNCDSQTPTFAGRNKGKADPVE